MFDLGNMGTVLEQLSISSTDKDIQDYFRELYRCSGKAKSFPQLPDKIPAISIHCNVG